MADTDRDAAISLDEAEAARRPFRPAGPLARAHARPRPRRRRRPTTTARAGERDGVRRREPARAPAATGDGGPGSGHSGADDEAGGGGGRVRTRRCSRRYAAGDQSAARTLTARHAPRVFAPRPADARRRHGGRGRDAGGDAQALALAPDWEEGRGALGTWLYRVAANLCIDRLRRRRETTAVAVPEVADEAPGAQRMLEAARPRRRRSRRRSPRCPSGSGSRSCCATSRTGANPEIAAVLDTSVEAVESLLARAPPGARRRPRGPARTNWGSPMDDDREARRMTTKRRGRARRRSSRRRGPRRPSPRRRSCRRSSPTPPRSPPRGATAPPAPAPAGRRWRGGLAAALGGWRGAAALAACGLFGFWLGLAGGVSLDGTTLQAGVDGRRGRRRVGRGLLRPGGGGVARMADLRPRSWRNWALVASLGLNLAFVGLLAGALDQGPAAAAVPGHRAVRPRAARSLPPRPRTRPAREPPRLVGPARGAARPARGARRGADRRALRSRGRGRRARARTAAVRRPLAARQPAAARADRADDPGRARRLCRGADRGTPRPRPVALTRPVPPGPGQAAWAKLTRLRPASLEV